MRMDRLQVVEGRITQPILTIPSPVVRTKNLADILENRRGLWLLANE